MSTEKTVPGARKKYATPLLIALLVIFTAVLGAVSPFSLAIGSVPVTLSVLVLVIIGVVLGPWWGLIPVAAYLLLGLAGVPVYSGFAQGPGILFGATGGYLFSFLFIVLLTGLFARRFRNPIVRFAGVILGQLAYYLGGAAWAVLLWKSILVFAVLSGVLSFLVPNLIQSVVGFIIGLALLRLLPPQKPKKE
jgi:Uncharacterized conserved protein